MFLSPRGKLFQNTLKMDRKWFGKLKIHFKIQMEKNFI